MSSWTLHKEGLKCTAVSKYLIFKDKPKFLHFLFFGSRHKLIILSKK